METMIAVEDDKQTQDKLKEAESAPKKGNQQPARYWTLSSYSNDQILLKGPDGEEFRVMTNTTPVFGKSGSPVGIITFSSDVTLTREEQELVRIKEERLNYALTEAEAGLWDWNLKTGEGYCSPRCYYMLGYENNEFTYNSETWRRMIYPDDRDRVLAELNDLLANNVREYQVQYRMSSKNGSYRWILSRGLAMEYDSNGTPCRFLGTHRDITDQKQMEMELHRSRNELELEVEKRTKALMEMNRQLEAIFNMSSESIWVCDNEGYVIKISNATTKLYNVKPEEVVGRNVRDLIDQGFMDCSATLEVLAQKKQVSMIQNIPRYDRQLLLTGTPIFDEKGRISLVTIVERDLTELNRLHEELERNQLLSKRYEQELNEWNVWEEQKEYFVAESVRMKNVLRTAIKLASQNVSNILILGESGTGKGKLSKLIHRYSSRREGPFIEINCAALPETLLEAELFGYDKGAFTGAREQGKAGLFELANKGTLFLDEIGDMPLPLQAKLLKYLDDNTIMHLGGLKAIPIDCTIIAATNRDLETRVRQKEFRKDLYYRLNTFTINIPPLRERQDDILKLTQRFIEQYNKLFNHQKKLSPKAVNALQSYRFPGNVRELKSLIKKAVVLSEGTSLDNVLLEAIGRGRLIDILDINYSDTTAHSLEDQLNRYERLILENAVKRYRTTRQIARHLHTSQTSIVRKLKKYGLSRD